VTREEVRGLVTRVYGECCDASLESGRQVQCYLSGRLRRSDSDVLAGDRVLIETNTGTPTVVRILKRSNQLDRPRVANVDFLVVLFSGRDPETNLLLVDAVLVRAEEAGLEPLVVLNKIDLLAPGRASELLGPYHKAGYRVRAVAAARGWGMSALARSLAGGLGVLAGESGVGKSTLLNALLPDTHLRTAETSGSERGRHTTRAVTFLPFGQGWLADTPGFSQVSVSGIYKENLSFYFREMRPFIPQCRFSSNCLHETEPGCAVRRAVDQGDIDDGRYRRYLALLSQSREWEERMY